MPKKSKSPFVPAPEDALPPPPPSATLGALALQDNAEEESGSDEEDEEEEDEYPDAMEGIPPAMVRRVEYLASLHKSQKEAIQDAYQIERAKLEQKFQAQYAAVYEERRMVISGESDSKVDSDFVAKGGEINAEEESAVDQVVGCPQFWLCAMGQFPTIAEQLNENDVDCLEYLADITSSDFRETRGFTLSFHFATNPYFSNTVLTKTYTIPNLYLDDEPILEKVEGCEINWLDTKCLTFQDVVKKQRSKSGKNKGQVRTITTKERKESFFHFFTPPTLPTEEMDDEEADAIEEAFDQDYEMASGFRTYLIPNAVMWFTGEAAEGEEGEEEDDYEEGGSEDDEDDDDDEDEEDEPVPKKGSKGKTKAIKGAASASPFPPGAEGDATNPECKQN